MSHNKPHYVVLGAGISGLTCAYYLKKKYQDSIQLTILEKSDRAGGYIQTIKKNGFLFELGPRSCRSKGSGVATLRLTENLGLQQDIIYPDKSAAIRYLYHNNELKALPNTLYSFLLSPLMKGVHKQLLKEIFIKPNLKDETVFEFISRRFSPNIAEQFMDPLVLGIYAGDIKNLSITACFPYLKELETSYGSIIKGLIHKRRQKQIHESEFIKEAQTHSLFSYRNGLQTLVSALTNDLKHNFVFNSEVGAITNDDNKFVIQTKEGREYIADKVISTLPAFALSTVLKPHFSKFLEQISTKSVAVVSLGYSHDVNSKNGFGYLIPSKEKKKILGVVWDSCVFPQHKKDQSQTTLTVMIDTEKVHTKNPDDIVKIALENLEEQLQITSKPDTANVYMAENAIPQYHVGHVDRIMEFTQLLGQEMPNFHLIGNSFLGVSINDCVFEAERLAKNL